MAVDAAERRTQGRAAGQPGTPSSHLQLFDSVVDEGDDVVRHRLVSAATDSWLLGEHVVRGGDALIPGTGYLEIVRSAAVAGRTRPAPSSCATCSSWRRSSVAADEVRTLRVKVDAVPTSRASWSSATAEASPHVHRHGRGRSTRRAGAAPRSRRDSCAVQRAGSRSSTATATSRSWTSVRAGATCAASTTATARRWSPRRCPPSSSTSCRRCGCTRGCSTWPPAAPRR